MLEKQPREEAIKRKEQNQDGHGSCRCIPNISSTKIKSKYFFSTRIYNRSSKRCHTGKSILLLRQQLELLPKIMFFRQTRTKALRKQSFNFDQAMEEVAGEIFNLK